jgi:hypothetical protein
MCDILTAALPGTGSSAFDRSPYLGWCTAPVLLYGAHLRAATELQRRADCAPPFTKDYSSCTTAIDSGDVVSGKAAP